MKKTVAIFFGGCSSEYKVSLMSAASVIKNINKEKYAVVLIGITRSGDFYLYEGDENEIEKDLWFKEKFLRKITVSVNRSDHGIIMTDTGEIKKIDVAFPVLHGRNGEDGRLQGLLELAGIKCAGCGMTSSAICMDKHLAHELAASKGFAVPKGYLFKKTDSFDYVEEKIFDLRYPLFVKPLKAGSSVGVGKIRSLGELEAALKEAFVYDNKVLIEESVDGFEVGCAVLGNLAPIVGEIDEIELENENGFFDFYEKYSLKTSKIHLPARLAQCEKEKIKAFALNIYKILGCKGFARVDMFYTKDKRIIFNEVNTIPGFTSHSRYPNMLNSAGISFEETIERLIELAEE